ncbi:MAG: hypothetical protein QXG08_03180 [Candidatus Methanomethyliaceae archaeon]
MNNTTNQVTSIITKALDLIGEINRFIIEKLVPMLSPIFGEQLARILVYLVILGATFYAIKSSSGGWFKYILIVIFVVILLAFLRG